MPATVLVHQSASTSRWQKTIQSLSANKLTILDIFERFFIVAFFLRFAVLTSFGLLTQLDIRFVLLFVSELAPACYVLFRKPSHKISTRPSDWLLALAGSILPLLINPGTTAPIVPVVVCYLLVVLGLFTQLSAKIALGRSFGIVAANRGVKIIGPYRLIRHPMYAGYAVAHIGLWLAAPSLFNAVLYVSALLLQIARIAREERILTRDPEYRDFAARVPYRLLPGVF